MDNAYKRPATVELLTELIADLDKGIAAQQHRWILGLAVANAAGLTSIGARVFDLLHQTGSVEAREAAIAMALPSFWLFLVGLIAVAAAHVGELVRDLNSSLSLRQARRQMLENPGITAEIGPSRKSWWEWAKIWFAEGVSATAFVAGLAYPAVVIGIRYFKDGGVALS